MDCSKETTFDLGRQIDSKCSSCAKQVPLENTWKCLGKNCDTILCRKCFYDEDEVDNCQKCGRLLCQWHFTRLGSSIDDICNYCQSTRL
jgi:hypothetical protein